MPKKKTQAETIIEFKKVHGDFYDYSQVEYVTTNKKVKIICPDHGLFEITPGHHKKGVRCKKCYFQTQKVTKEEFISRSQKHFGESFDYSLFTILPHFTKKVQIKCKVHDLIFLQQAQNHMDGHVGCPKCKSFMQSGSSNTRGTIKSKEELTNEFIERAKKVHGYKFNYGEFEYVRSTVKGKIICPIHGEFYQAPSNHLQGHMCPECSIDKKKEGTFKKECRDRGVDYWSALKRREAGLSDDKIFNPESIRGIQEINLITVYGKEYPNLKEAIRILKPLASRKTIARDIKKGISPEDAFERIPNPGFADGSIYLITNQITKKQYVGLTIQTIELRWKGHLEHSLSKRIKDKNSLHAALRKYGADSFTIEIIDKGTANRDLEGKERDWIKKLNTLAPNGYNILSQGSSGGSIKKPTKIDNIVFESVNNAAKYLAETRDISLDAAKKRISIGNINAKKPSKEGQGYCHTKTYRAHNRIIRGVLNPKSREYIPEITLYNPWYDFQNFLSDVGNQTDQTMAFVRIDKTQGYYPENCKWVKRPRKSKHSPKTS